MFSDFEIYDIRPITLDKKQKEAIKRDLNWLKRKSNDFSFVKCPACGRGDSILQFTKDNFKYYKCNYCFTTYVSPRPNQATLSEFYKFSQVYKYWNKNVYEKKEVNRKKFLFKPRAELIVEKCKKANIKENHILEVGSSSGFFLEEAKKLKFFKSLIGIEPTPSQAKVSKAKGIDTYCMGYENFNISKKFSAIVSFETIEHLFSPYEYLKWARKKLLKFGYVMLTCPNFHGIEPILFGVKSKCVDHEHLNYFNPSSMNILLRRAGFSNVEITSTGALDIDIMSNALKNKKIEESKINIFLLKILKSKNKKDKRDFQNFIRTFNLSSNMLVIAQKI